MRAAEVEAGFTIEPETAGKFAWQEKLLTFTPDEPWPAGTEVRVRLAPGARPQFFPPLALSAGREWRFTIRKPRLAFLTPADGPANILLWDENAASGSFLTDFSTGVGDFSLDSRGWSIFFSVNNPEGGSDIYRHNMALPSGLSMPEAELVGPDPGAAGPVVVAACAPAACRSPVVSPNGEWLAYERVDLPEPGQAERPQVWIKSLNEPGEATLVDVSTTSASLPAWSPDGRLTVFSPDAEVFIVLGADGAEQLRFTNATGQPGAWQPNGETFIAPEIYFLDANISPALQQQLDRLADSHLLQYRAGQGKPVDLTAVEGIEDISPQISPDGRSLAFARKYLDAARWTPGRQLWLMDLVTRAARPLTEDQDYTHFDFVWSPDGRRLAYVRFNQSMLTEPPEIWVLEIDSGKRHLIYKGGYSPLWIP